MKKYTLLLVCAICLFNAHSLSAQCVVDAGEDVEVCGDTLQLNASLNEGDYDASWSTNSSEIEILDVNSPTSQVVLIDGFISSNTYSYDLIWTITNADGLTCSESANIIFKIIPSCEFLMDDTICSGSTSEIEYVYDIPFNPCPSMNDLIFDNDLIYGTNFSIQGTGNPCIYDLMLNNTTGEALTYLVGLQFEYNGCLSDLCEEYVTVLPELITYAGDDTTIAGHEYTLQAEMSNSADSGRWIFTQGPTVVFPNDDHGFGFIPGNPNAEIIGNPGPASLLWREWEGECVSEDEVVITFLGTANCNVLYAESELSMPTSVSSENGSIDIVPHGGEAPYTYNWSNVSEEQSENEDVEGLVEGLYSLTLTDNNNQQHIKHHYLIANMDSSLFQNPLDTLVATFDTCYGADQAEVYDYIIIGDEILVSWICESNLGHITLLSVIYPNINTDGVYIFTLNIICVNNGGTFIQSFSSPLYLTYDDMSGFEQHNLFEGKIYPNPTDGLVNIDVKGVTEMVLTDITGRVISDRIQTEASGKRQIDLSNQKSGIYLLHLLTKEGQQVVKLIKE